MKLIKFRSLVFSSIAAYALIMTGCGSSGGSGGDDNGTKGGGDQDGGGVQADTTAPVITSGATATIVENTPLIHKVIATDANTITYSIFGGTDASKFTIDPATGDLSFTAPAVDNVAQTFLVTVKAEDASANSSTQDITVTVTDAGLITNRAIMPLVPLATTFSKRNDANTTVTNALTGFIWEDQPFNENNVTFNQAKAHCDGLKIDGINNWRLPTRADLFKLARYTPNPNNGSYTADGFFHKKGASYWTSQEIDANTAWVVTFGGIGDLKASKDFTGADALAEAYVRCVSGHHQPPVFGGSDTDQTRTDADTGLTWHTHSHDNLVAPIDNGNYPEGNFSTAQATCTTYGEGYRLPNINELRSIVEYEAKKVTDIKGANDENISVTILGSVFGDFTISEIDGDLYDSKSEEGGFGTVVWSSTRTADDKVRALYISPINPVSGATGEISGTVLDDNLTKAPGTPDPIRTICVKN